MQQLIRALAALAAALVFAGCGAEAGSTAGPEGIGCEARSSVDDKLSGSPGYDPEGCTVRDRMRNVPISAFLGPEPGFEDEYGSAKEPITISRDPDGFSLGVKVQPTNSSFSDYAAQLGGCPWDPNWTVNQPIRGHCIVPFDIKFSWSLCPDCYHEGMWGSTYWYLEEAMAEAWRLWGMGEGTVDCEGGGLRVNAGLYEGEETSRDGGGWADYGAADLSIYPIWDHPGYRMAWYAPVNAISHYSGTQGGVKYHGWKSSSIVIDHITMEETMTANCGISPQRLGPMEFERVMHNAYVNSFAHELGHALGFPHLLNNTAVLMTNNPTCGDVFDNITPPNIGMRQMAAIYRNSNGLNTVAHNGMSFPNGYDDQQCWVTPYDATGVIDDARSNP